MLIEVTAVVPGPGGVLVRCRSQVGEALVAWRGSAPPVRGPHHVEWTVDLDAVWGGNLTASTVPAAGLGMDGDTVVIRGRLRRGPAGTATIEIGGTFIAVDLAGPVPPAGWDRWAELRVPSSAAEVYPYQL